MWVDSHVVASLVDFHYERLRPDPDGRLHLHVHHYHQVDVYMDGAATIHSEHGPPFRVGRGDVVLIPPLARHGYAVHGELAQTTFKVNLAPRYWTHFGRRLRRTRVGRDLLDLIDSTGESFLAGEALAAEQVTAVAELCLVRCLRDRPAAGAESNQTSAWHGAVWAVLEAVGARPYDGWTVRELARRCHLNVDYFTRKFTAEFGQSPQRCLLELRMRAAAADLLAADRPPIKHVAAAAGYSSLHAFTRAFKKVFGAGPAAYRRQQPMT